MARRAKSAPAKAGTKGKGARKAKPPTPRRARPAAAPWIDHYPPGISWDTPLKPTTLPAMFDEAAKAYGKRPCTDFMGARLSYREMAGLIDRVAAGLEAAGIGRGHRVGLMLPNTPYYVAAYFAVLKTGAAAVNFNPLYTVEELKAQAGDAAIVAMVTLDLKLLFEKVAELAVGGQIEKIVVCPFGDILPTVTRLMFRLFKSGEVANPAASPAASKVISWRDLAATRTKPGDIILRPDDVALLQYTGGTTGEPKAAVLTHANLTVNVQQIAAWSPGMIEPGKERILGVLPFFHVFAMTTIMNFAVHCGALMILLPRFDLRQAVKTMHAQKPTIMPAVPTLFTALLNFPGVRKEDLSSLKFCISGGAPLPNVVRKSFEDFAGCRVVEGYGLSETSPVAACNPFEGLKKDNSIGQPAPGTDISIRALEDPKKGVALGEKGEICIKGPQVMQGYWKRPEVNEETFVDGFFRTGDVGYMDDDGFIFIVDRIKDMINCSGFKVYPRRIEEAIHTHPAVAEVTVIGIPDAYRGEAPKAFIVLKDGANTTEAEILAHLEPKLSRIEMPAKIEFRDELPKTMVGKLSKKELRESSS